MTYDEISSAIMDEYNDLVYVSDPETYELLYLNRVGCDAFGADYRGKRCYQLLQGRDAPCPFCTNHLLTPDSYYIWERYNEILGRYYFLKDKLMLLDGKYVRLEICTDITDKEELSLQLQQKLHTEETLVRCIQTLREDKDASSAIGSLLEIIGEFYLAERAYIFECDYAYGRLSNTYEWCKPGVTPQLGNLQDLPIHLVDNWVERFRSSGEFFITSLGQDLAPDAPDYQILKDQDIESLMAAPLLEESGEIAGFIGVDNPSANTEDTALLRSITYFVMDDITKRRMMARLERASYTDLLTGMDNRNRYIRRLNELDAHPPDALGVVYVDINGLKIANDTYGHEYGDGLIVRTAALLRSIFPQNVFRIGGDEFVVLCPDMARAAFEACTRELRRRAAESDDYSLSIGASWNQGSLAVKEQVIYADELMYMEKEAYYSTVVTGQSSRYANLSGELRRAIENGRYVVFLSPFLDEQTGQLTGAEAQVHCRAASGLLIPPEKFIPLYEAEGVVRQVDLFALETVCGALSAWSGRAAALPSITLNFSYITLMETGAVDRLRSIADRCEVPLGAVRIRVGSSRSSLTPEGLAQLRQRVTDGGFCPAAEGPAGKTTGETLTVAQFLEKYISAAGV